MFLHHGFLSYLLHGLGSRTPDQLLEQSQPAQIPEAEWIDAGPGFQISDVCQRWEGFLKAGEHGSLLDQHELGHMDGLSQSASRRLTPGICDVCR